MVAAEALRLIGKHLVRAVRDPADIEARTEMLYAATLGGIAFANAGCHLPHGMSYAVSGLVRAINRGFKDAAADPKAALVWYLRAKAGGIVDDALEVELMKRLSEAEIAEAKRLAGEAPASRPEGG